MCKIHPYTLCYILSLCTLRLRYYYSDFHKRISGSVDIFTTGEDDIGHVTGYRYGIGNGGIVTLIYYGATLADVFRYFVSIGPDRRIVLSARDKISVGRIYSMNYRFITLAMILFLPNLPPYHSGRLPTKSAEYVRL